MDKHYLVKMNSAAEVQAVEEVLSFLTKNNLLSEKVRWVVSGPSTKEFEAYIKVLDK